MNQLKSLTLKADSLDRVLVEMAEKHDMDEWLEFENSTVIVLGYSDYKVLANVMRYRIARLKLPLVVVTVGTTVFVVHKWKIRPRGFYRDTKFDWG